MQIPHCWACLHLALQAQIFYQNGANEEVHHPFILKLTFAKLSTSTTPKALALIATIFNINNLEELTLGCCPIKGPTLSFHFE